MGEVRPHWWVERRKEREVERWKFICLVIALTGGVGWLFVGVLVAECWFKP